MTRERPGLWASLKRALEPRPPGVRGTDGSPLEPGVRGTNGPPLDSEEPIPFLSEDRDVGPIVPDAPATAAPPPPAPELVRPPCEPIVEPDVAAAPAPRPDPPGRTPRQPESRPQVAEARPPLPEEPPRPRLARGLASFSKANKEREARFAHILRADPKSRGGKGSGAKS